MTTVCLSMIVKNEAAVIRRCLESVAPMIDSYCIVDTGSEDDTKEIIRDTLGDIPGMVLERPWVDFAHNRTEALELARPMADYSFIIDADDWLDCPLKMEGLDADAYTVGILNSGITYRRIQMVRNALPWVWKGVVHEFLEYAEAGPARDLPLIIRCGNNGARSLDPEKYRRDAEALELALNTETDPFLKSRYGFYLGQSYRDCGDRNRAFFWFRWRARQAFWVEEVYISLLNAARIAEELYPAEAEDLYQEAIDAVPGRAEAYHGLARLYRAREEFGKGFYTAKRAIDLPPPAGGLFVEQWIYDWGLLDELAISAYWSGNFRHSLDACELILSEGRCTDLDRIKVNANFARRKLVAK